MKRVAVIGIMGAGKSTVSNLLGQKLGIEVYHLDKLFWKPGWVQIPYQERDKIQKEIVLKDVWIIDGNWTGSLDIRLPRADTIIFLDFPKWFGLYRIFKRRIKQIFTNEQSFDKADGVKEKISWKLIKTTVGYPSSYVNEIIDSYEDGKEVYRFKNQKEVDLFLSKL